MNMTEINEESCKIYRQHCGKALLYSITPYLTTHPQYTQSQKGTYNTSFVPLALVLIHFKHSIVQHRVLPYVIQTDVSVCLLDSDCCQAILCGILKFHIFKLAYL